MFLDHNTHTHTHTHTKRQAQAAGLLETKCSARLRVYYLQKINTHETKIHAFVGIRTRAPSKRVGAFRRMRSRGHQDWMLVTLHSLD